MGKVYTYLHAIESPPKLPRAQNKNLTAKVMFLAAFVARPRKMSNGVWFDGKIGIWPIVDTKVAQPTSKHRAKGTKVLVLAMVDGERYKKLMIEALIPAIKACMPRPEGHTVFVQQDGAMPHTKVGIIETIEEAVRGDNVKETQSDNSPDLDVNDLRFFYSIHQLKEYAGVTNTQELEVTAEAFDVYHRDTLERVWQSLFALYGEVLGSKGDNVYKIPHLGTEKAEKEGKLPENALVDATNTVLEWSFGELWGRHHRSRLPNFA
ncbi:unnamed protein product [Discosporangium mesarthrocarpum]